MIVAQVMHQWGGEGKAGVIVLLLVVLLFIILGLGKKKP